MAVTLALQLISNSSVTVANVKVDGIKYVCEYTHCNASVVHFCYLDNHSAVGDMERAISAFPLIEMTECGPLQTRVIR